jgi:hypothetical protein
MWWHVQDTRRAVHSTFWAETRWQWRKHTWRVLRPDGGEHWHVVAGLMWRRPEEEEDEER